MHRLSTVSASTQIFDRFGFQSFGCKGEVRLRYARTLHTVAELHSLVLMPMTKGEYTLTSEGDLMEDTFLTKYFYDTVESRRIHLFCIEKC